MSDTEPSPPTAVTLESHEIAAVLGYTEGELSVRVESGPELAKADSPLMHLTTAIAERLLYDPRFPQMMMDWAAKRVKP